MNVYTLRLSLLLQSVTSKTPYIVPITMLFTFPLSVSSVSSSVLSINFVLKQQVIEVNAQLTSQQGEWSTTPSPA